MTNKAEVEIEKKEKEGINRSWDEHPRDEEKKKLLIAGKRRKNQQHAL